MLQGDVLLIGPSPLSDPVYPSSTKRIPRERVAVKTSTFSGPFLESRPVYGFRFQGSGVFFVSPQTTTFPFYDGSYLRSEGVGGRVLSCDDSHTCRWDSSRLPQLDGQRFSP